MSQTLASKLKHRITLQQPALTSDTQGGYMRGWEDVAELWAEIVPQDRINITYERVQHEQLQMRITHRITLRWRAGVTSDMRILHESRAFNIRAVFNAQEENNALILLAEEGAAT